MKQKEIDRLQEEIVSLTKLKDKMNNKVKRYQKFSKFLEQSVEFSDDFQEVRELIDRYETLITNYKDLLEVEKENEEKINEYRRQLNAYLDVRLLRTHCKLKNAHSYQNLIHLLFRKRTTKY
jgi:hypothetical protein